MERSEEVGDLIAALAKAQAEFTFASKDSTNPAFNSRYADLAANLIAVRPALSKHGIAIMQFDESDVERQTASVTTSLHFANQWISATAEAPAVGMKGFNVLYTPGSLRARQRRRRRQLACGREQARGSQEDRECASHAQGSPRGFRGRYLRRAVAVLCQGQGTRLGTR